MGLRLAEDLELPVEVATEAVAILATRGAGKTYAAGVLAEELVAAGVQVVVLDPVGKHWGLTVGADGRAEAGLPLHVLGGRHGDVPLNPDSGKAVAAFLVETGASAVLDVHLFDTDAEHRRFAADFLRELYRRKRGQDDPAPLHLIVEEAEEFAPQAFEGADTHMINAIKKVVKLGRNYGIGCTLVSQRSADVNKKILSQVGMLIAMRTASAQDRKAVKSWAEPLLDDSEVSPTTRIRALSKFAAGEAIVWHPQHGIDQRVQIRRRRTLDTSATPKVGAKKKIAAAERKRASGAALEQLRGAMADAIAAAEADDTGALQRQVRKLKARIAELEASPATVVERVAVVPPQELLDQLSAGAKAIDSGYAKIRVATTDLGRWRVRAITEGGADVEGDPEQDGVITPITPQGDALAGRVINRRPAAAAKVATPARPPAPPADGGLEGVPKGAREMARALLLGGLSRRDCGLVAGISPRGGTFAKYFGLLRAAGLIEETGDGLVRLTDAGRAGLNGAAPPLAEDVRAYWHRAAGARGVRAMLAVLLEVYPRELGRAELGAKAGIAPTGGTFAKYLGALRAKSLIDEPGGKVRAAAALFFD